MRNLVVTAATAEFMQSFIIQLLLDFAEMNERLTYLKAAVTPDHPPTPVSVEQHAVNVKSISPKPSL